MGLVAVYGIVFLLLLSGSIPCSFARMTHQPCPGCGTTRSGIALLHGDFHSAFHFNPLGPFVIACLGVLAVDSVRLVAKDGDLRDFADSRAATWALGVLLVASILQVVVWMVRFFGYLGGPVPLT
ncbi:hypothetical protein BH09MYX1_BH09MYX1_39560 [soil metagenome]